MSSFRITPIGTCRVHTPLSRAAGRYDVKVDLRRNYGFVHTSEEALQQLRFLQGEKQFRPELVPLVFFRGDAEELAGQHWEPSDLHIVEISSSKRITCRGEPVQINYLYHHFSDFFASNERARRFWNLVRAGHRQDVVDFLDAQRVSHLLSPDDRELLADLSFDQQSFRAVKRDMEEIADRLGRDKLVFVTHVNATTPDGEIISARDRLIRWVKLAGEQLEVRVFDPTAAMADFGQDKALDDRGLDLTHYTGAFSDRVYDAIHREYVAPLLEYQPEPGTDDRSRQVAAIGAKIESEIELGDFFAGSRELHRALELFPDAPRLIRLRGLIRSRIGDCRGAVDDLSRFEDRTMPADVRLAFAESLSEIGDYEGALRTAQGLMAEEVESPALYRVAEKAARCVGKSDLAIAFAKQAYRLDRRDLSSALRALNLMSASSADDQIPEWRNEILENVRASANGAFEICLWAVRHGDEGLFAAGLEAVVVSDKAGGIDLMEEAFNAELPRALAASIPIAARLGRMSRGLAERRLGLIAAALEWARNLAELENVPAAYQIAHSIEDLAGTPTDQLPVSRLVGEARRLIRGLAANARATVRSAYLAGDLPAVIDAGKRAGDVLRHDSATTTLVARALHATGETRAGLALLTGLAPGEREHFLVRRWTARLAAAVQDYTVALEMYGSLREGNEADAAKLKPEIDRFFASAQARGHKQLNLFAREGKVEEAVQLAHAMNKYIGPHERTERELGRMHKQMRIRLRQIEEGDGMIEDRELVLRQMILVRPDDLVSLRRLAIELMRQFRFAEAGECWERICELDSKNESADRNRVRCATLAQRRTSASVQLADAVA